MPDINMVICVRMLSNIWHIQLHSPISSLHIEYFQKKNKESMNASMAINKEYNLG